METQSKLANRDATEAINRCVASVNLMMSLLSFLGAATISAAALTGGSNFFMVAGLALMTPAVIVMIVCSIIARHLRWYADQQQLNSRKVDLAKDPAA